MESIRIPVTFEDIVAEIVAFTDMPQADVAHRVWMEALELGWNVGPDIARFNVTPHVYGPEMLRLYEESTAFIFETMVFWAKPIRRRWIEQAAERVRLYAAQAGLHPEQVRILMLGDGTGNDSLYLVQEGFHVDYFDVPGSKTFQFAVDRFKHYNLLDRHITVLPDYQACLTRQYDAVICFEVLEHLPEPLSSIRDMYFMLKMGGIALITEAFGLIRPNLPTHVASNAKYAKETAFLFLARGLLLSWYSPAPDHKPMEYTKVKNRSARDFVRLIADTTISKRYLALALSAVLDRAEQVVGRVL